MFRYAKVLAGAALSAVLISGIARPAQAAPANDLFVRAQGVGGLEGRVEGSLVGATTESGERENNYFQRIGVSVWYRWVAPFDGLARFGADGRGLNMGIAAYTGTGISSLVEARDSDNLFVSTVFRAEAGQAYYIQVGADSLGTAPFTLTYSLTVAPSNDDFARAITLRGSNGVVQGVTSGSTTESGESGFSTGTVWFRYVAPASGRLNLNVFGFTPSVRLYSGSAISNLNPIFDSQVTAGQTYFIQVAGRNAEAERFFRLTYAGPGAETFSISGRVLRTTFGGSLVGAYGARVTAGGQVAITDGLGYYNFTGLPRGSYTVAASLPGSTLAPPSQTVALTTNLSTVDFRANVGGGTPVGSLSISGRIVDSSGRPLANVTLTRTGGARVVTNSAGQYVFLGVAAGSYTISPSLANYNFHPSAAIVTVRRASVPNINFLGVTVASGLGAPSQPQPKGPSTRVSRGPSKYLQR